MKLLRVGLTGQERPALLDDAGQVRDLSNHVDDVGGAALSPESLNTLRNLDPGSLPVLDPSTRIGPCIAQVGKIVCIGLNYVDHAAEANMTQPTEPILFLKPSSAITGPHDPIEIPPGAQKTDWEVELGVVIGSPGRYLTQSRALDHVAGYCIVDDVSERAYQLERGGQWDKGKGCDSFAPLGPWLVTRDEVPDPQTLDLWLEVDGHRFQSGNTRNMIFSVNQLVAYVSQFMSLQPGDVIATGTPAGVGLGQRPPRFLRPGQTVRAGIAGLGEQVQRTTTMGFMAN